MIHQPMLRVSYIYIYAVTVLPACPFSTCATAGISLNPHPEGEPCVYQLYILGIIITLCPTLVDGYVLDFAVRSKEVRNV